MSLPRIYPTVKEIVPGPVYIEYTCGCIFLDSEDRKRKKRSIFEITKGKRTNRVFCPNHKQKSFLKSRFKICPNCNKTIITANNTTEGPCSLCNAHFKKEKHKKQNIKPKDCLQYGKQYKLRKNEKIISKHMCRNREYCLSFIKKAATLLQCNNCPHLNDDVFGD